MTFYVDGILQTALKQPYTSNNSTKFGNYPVYLFSRGGISEFSAGQISDLQIYNRALSASDVQTLYNSAASDFTLTALPSSQTVFQGSGTSYTANVTPLEWFQRIRRHERDRIAVGRHGFLQSQSSLIRIFHFDRYHRSDNSGRVLYDDDHGHERQPNA